MIEKHKKVTIVGIGTGNGTLTLEAINAIKDAEVLIGAQRMLDLAADVSMEVQAGSKRVYPHYLAEEITKTIKAESSERFAVLVSGDVGFYSAAVGLAECLGEAGAELELIFVPGISIVNAFFAKLKLPWQSAAFVSAHGREADIVSYVRRNRLTFCLPGNNVGDIGTALTQTGLSHIKTYVGENLGTEPERVYETLAEDLTNLDCPSLTVLLFENEAFDDRTLTGLPDNQFSRLDGIPMTKSETRAIVMSKLKIRPSSICWDIGAGTGSVTVEMALSAYFGHVYAVERRGGALPLIEKNCESFHIGNVTVLHGEAPGTLESLPAPDSVFIGGSGGEIANIIALVRDKNPRARIVITSITPETVSLASAAFKAAGEDIELTQINVARGKLVSGLHLMEAQNPVTIICAGGEL